MSKKQNRIWVPMADTLTVIAGNPNISGVELAAIVHQTTPDDVRAQALALRGKVIEDKRKQIAALQAQIGESTKVAAPQATPKAS